MAARRAPPPTDWAKQFTIKVNVCKRMDKEVKFYEKEAAENEAKLKTMKDEGRDNYETKQWEEVLQESYMMIPDSTKRFERSLEELLSFLEEHGQEEAIVAKAELLAEAKQILASNGLEFLEPGDGAEDESGAAASTSDADFKEGEIF